MLTLTGRINRERKAEKEVLLSITGNTPLPVLKSNGIAYLKKHAEAIERLKQRGLICKDKNHILKVKYTRFEYECVLKDAIDNRYGQYFTPTMIDYENECVWCQHGQSSGNGEWLGFSEVIIYYNQCFKPFTSDF